MIRIGLVLAMMSAAPSDPRRTGKFDRQALEQVVNKHVDEIQRCYERELDDEKKPAGKIVVAWTVAADGSVKRPRIKSDTVGRPNLPQCIMATLRTWKFPAPDTREVEVEFPFSFRHD